MPVPAAHSPDLTGYPDTQRAEESDALVTSLGQQRPTLQPGSIVDAIPGGLLVVGTDGTIVDANSGAVDMLGAPLVGCAWSAIVKREFCRGPYVDGALQLRGGRWINLARRALRGEPGEVLLLSDISIVRQTQALNRRARDIQDANEMTARLSHQVRTPLASAMLHVSTLVSKCDGEIQAHARNAQARLTDINELITESLQVASGNNDSTEQFLVSALLRDVCQTMLPQLRNTDQLRVEVADATLSMRGNRCALLGALSNLVANALQASDDSAQVELSAVQFDGMTYLIVSDNGDGIREDIQDRLFDPFFTTRARGTGLGLAVVRSVAEAHDGDVLVQSKHKINGTDGVGDAGDTSGSVFTIAIPAADKRRISQTTSPQKSDLQ